VNDTQEYLKVFEGKRALTWYYTIYEYIE